MHKKSLTLSSVARRACEHLHQNFPAGERTRPGVLRPAPSPDDSSVSISSEARRACEHLGFQISKLKRPLSPLSTEWLQYFLNRSGNGKTFCTKTNQC